MDDPGHRRVKEEDRGHRRVKEEDHGHSRRPEDTYPVKVEPERDSRWYVGRTSTHVGQFLGLTRTNLSKERLTCVTKTEF